MNRYLTSDLLASIGLLNSSFVESSCGEGDSVELALEFFEEEMIFISSLNRRELSKLSSRHRQLKTFLAAPQKFYEMLPRFRKNDSVIFSLNPTLADAYFELNYVFENFWFNRTTVLLPLVETFSSYERILKLAMRYDVLLQYERGAENKTILIIEHK